MKMLQISGYNCLRDTNLKTPPFSRNASSSNCGKLSALLLLLPDTVTTGAHPQVKILCTTPDFRQHPQKRPSDQLSTKTCMRQPQNRFLFHQLWVEFPSTISQPTKKKQQKKKKKKKFDFFLTTGLTSFSALNNTKKPLSCS
jgi:hypothetical protein